MNPLRLVAEHRDAIMVTLACFIASLLVATIVVRAGLRSFRVPDPASPRGTPPSGIACLFALLAMYVVLPRPSTGSAGM